MKICVWEKNAWMKKMSIIKNTPKHEVKNADLDLLREMKIADEMYARGYEFWPLDIYKAKAKDFQVIDGKIMPALTSIDGMGEKAAQQVEEAAKGEPLHPWKTSATEQKHHKHVSRK